MHASNAVDASLNLSNVAILPLGEILRWRLNTGKLFKSAIDASSRLVEEVGVWTST